MRSDEWTSLTTRPCNTLSRRSSSWGQSWVERAWFISEFLSLFWYFPTNISSFCDHLGAGRYADLSVRVLYGHSRAGLSTYVQSMRTWLVTQLVTPQCIPFPRIYYGMSSEEEKSRPSRRSIILGTDNVQFSFSFTLPTYLYL
jgi:hypothetical protein